MIQAQELNVPVVMSEYNSVACGGSNISSTVSFTFLICEPSYLPTLQFAMSLWAVDVGLKAASMNYSAVFLHTREFEIQYNLFDPPSPHTSTDPGWRTGSPYYAALFLSEFTSPGGSVVIDLNLNNSITSPYATVAGYGIYSDSGTKREKLVFINFASDSQVFIIPRGFAQKVEYKLLVAPDVLERTNISWAGQTIGNNGNLEGDEQLIEMNCENGCRVTVPGPGAVLIGLANAPLFTGNSTIAAIGAYMSGATSLNPGIPGLVFVFAALVTLLHILTV